MKVLYDTNVILDVLLLRMPHAEESVPAMGLVDRGKVDGLICATTITTIFYLGAKILGHRKTESRIRDLMAMFEIASVDAAVLTQSLDLGFPDFEDAVLHEAAKTAGAVAIVTRNRKDFARATLSVLSPQELLSLVSASG